MDEQVEKLMVALMVLLQEKGGEYKIDAEVFHEMFEDRHNKGIQVQEMGQEGVYLKMGDMNVSPDDAAMN